METGLTGDVVVVLGAAGGIGAAIARAFAAEGCALALLDRSARVEALATTLRDTHAVRVLSQVVDATDYGALQHAAGDVLTALGACQHVVVSIGVSSGHVGMPFWRVDPGVWDAVVRANLMSCVHAAHAFVPQLLPQRRGSFCFLSSVAGQIGSPTDPPYSAAKAAVLNFTQCAARDLAAHGIRANAICPGMVATDLNRRVWEASQSRAGGIGASGLRRLGRRQDPPRDPAGPLADARRRGGGRGVPRLTARGQRDGPDPQRRWRPGNALLEEAPRCPPWRSRTCDCGRSSRRRRRAVTCERAASQIGGDVPAATGHVPGRGAPVTLRSCVVAHARGASARRRPSRLWAIPVGQACDGDHTGLRQRRVPRDTVRAGVQPPRAVPRP